MVQHQHPCGKHQQASNLVGNPHSEDNRGERVEEQEQPEAEAADDDVAVLGEGGQRQLHHGLHAPLKPGGSQQQHNDESYENERYVSITMRLGRAGQGSTREGALT